MASRHYLIADADPGQRQLLDLLLSDLDTTLVAVESAKEALEFLRTNTPALAVLSYELPDLSGTEVAKRLKLVARLQRVPVVLTVDPGDGFGVPEHVRAAAEEAGVDLVLPKPLGDKALRERATRLILAAEARRERTGPAMRDTSVLEDSLREIDAEAPAADAKTQAAWLRAEVERLRSENAKLHQRVLTQQEELAKLRSEVDELRRGGRRGLFGRRRD